MSPFTEISFTDWIDAPGCEEWPYLLVCPFVVGAPAGSSVLAPKICALLAPDAGICWEGCLLYSMDHRNTSPGAVEISWMTFCKDCAPTAGIAEACSISARVRELVVVNHQRQSGFPILVKKPLPFRSSSRYSVRLLVPRITFLKVTETTELLFASVVQLDLDVPKYVFVATEKNFSDTLFFLKYSCSRTETRSLLLSQINHRCFSHC